MTGDDRQGKKPGRKVVLLGERGTKRTMYLEQAARQIGLPVFFIQWAHFGELWKEGFRDAVIKIDPPVWDSCDLEELEGLRPRVKAAIPDQRRREAVFKALFTARLAAGRPLEERELQALIHTV